jgi:DNA primase
MHTKIEDHVIQQLKDQTMEELILQDPQPVLNDLGIWYKELGNDSYQLNVRDERTPSAYISLRGGNWTYKDFGSGSGGTITNVVMDFAGKDFKEALNYSLQQLGVTNRLEEALNVAKQDYSLSVADKERLQKQRDNNKQKEKSVPISKVNKVYEVSSNQLAVDYLKSRGINKIPPGFQIITGEYTNRSGEVKKAYGVGVLTKEGKGADIHFLKKVGNLKTMSFGEKEISFFPNTGSNKVAVFESKMDYAAAYQQMSLEKVNVVIANGSANYRKVSNLLQKEDLTKDVMFFNQNDVAGYKFVKDVSQESKIGEFKSIKFDLVGKEKGKDINDLLLDNEKIASRIESTSIKKFETIYNVLDSKDEKMIYTLSTLLNNDINFDNNIQKVNEYKNLIENSVENARLNNQDINKSIINTIQNIKEKQNSKSQSLENKR